MAVAALLLAVLGVLVGTLMLADLNGPTSATPPRSLLVAHITLGLTTSVVLIAGTVVTGATIGWVGAAALVVTAAVGLLVFRHTHRAPHDLKRPGPAMLVVHGGVALVAIGLAIGAAAAAKG
ncbi:MAG: hypothetical protein ACYDH6_11515 [Acidimicrobiales bacterium]